MVATTPLAAATAPKFPSLWVLKAGRGTESLLIWAKPLRPCRGSINITKSSLFQWREKQRDDFAKSIWILPIFEYFWICFHFYIYTHIFYEKTFVLFTRIFHHTGEILQDLFLYHCGSFHARIFYQLSCWSFHGFKDMKNKFPGGRHAKGHETQRNDVQLRKPFSHG